MQRHEFGFEYPFWCNMASIGVELPVSHTINTRIDVNNPDIRNVEFGNVSLFLKGVLYQDCCQTFTAGLGVNLPTADDVVIFDGTAQARLDNDVVTLSPFLAYLHADPCSNMFFHGFVQFDLPTDEYSLDIDGDLGSVEDANVLHLEGMPNLRRLYGWPCSSR